MKKKKIGDIVAITKGRKAQKVFEEKLPKAVRYIQIEDLRTDNKIQYTTDTTGTFVSMNDLCIAWDGANAGTVGYGLSGVIGSTIARLRINDSEIYAPYIGHFLQSKFNILNGRTTGTTIPHVERNRLEELEFSCRPLSEQRRVAAILDKVDAIRRKRQHSLKLTASLVKSQFIEMFGDPVTNPMGWEKVSLDELGELNRGVSKHRPRNAPELLGGEYPLIQTGEVAGAGLYITEYSATYSEIGLKQSKMWPKGTLCITIAANIAKTGILGFDACFPDSIVGFTSGERTNQIFVYFLFVFFQKILEEQAPESAQKNINLQILKKLQVICPPRSLQTQFARFVEQADKSKFVMQNQLSEIEILLSALKQKFFA